MGQIRDEWVGEHNLMLDYLKVSKKKKNQGMFSC